MAELVHGFSLLALDYSVTEVDFVYMGGDGGCLYRRVRPGQFSCFALASVYFVLNSGSTSLLAKAVEQKQYFPSSWRMLGRRIA
jgi:hypothetical protein